MKFIFDGNQFKTKCPYRHDDINVGTIKCERCKSNINTSFVTHEVKCSIHEIQKLNVTVNQQRLIIIKLQQEITHLKRINKVQ